MSMSTQKEIGNQAIHFKEHKKTIFSFLVCAIGSFLNANNGGACELCAADTYSTSVNSASCMNCPSGTTTQEATGQTSQNACGELLNLRIR